MDFYQRVASLYGGLTEAEKKVVNYIRLYPDAIVKMNTKALGAAAGASPATVVRLARTLGYDTYQHMLIALAQSSAAGPQAAMPKENGGNLEGLSAQLLAVIQTSIVQTVSLLSLDTLREAARMIHDAAMLYLYGVGASGLVAQDLMQKLIFINRQSIYHSDSSFSVASTAHITADDLVIGFSYSGRNREVLFATETAKRNGAKTIGFTQANSQLAKLVDLHILLPHVDERLCGGSRLSRYPQSVAVDMLYMILLHSWSAENQKHAGETSRVILEHSARR